MHTLQYKTVVIFVHTTIELQIKDNVPAGRLFKTIYQNSENETVNYDILLYHRIQTPQLTIFSTKSVHDYRGKKARNLRQVKFT